MGTCKLLALGLLLNSMQSVYAQDLDNFSELTDDQIVPGFVQTTPPGQESEPNTTRNTSDDNAIGQSNVDQTSVQPSTNVDPAPIAPSQTMMVPQPLQESVARRPLQVESVVPSEKSRLTILLDSGYVEGFGQLVVTPLSGSRVSISYNPSVCSLQANLGSMIPTWNCSAAEEIISTGDIEPSTVVETAAPIAEDLVPMVAQSIGVLPGGFDLRVERRKNRPPRAFVVVDRRTLDHAASVAMPPAQADILTIELYPNVSFENE